MRYVMVGALFVLAISAQTALAGKIREIELNDGSVITGELLLLSNYCRGSKAFFLHQKRYGSEQRRKDYKNN